MHFGLPILLYACFSVLGLYFGDEGKFLKMALNIPKPILEKTKVMVTHPIEINVIRIDEMLMHFNL